MRDRRVGDQFTRREVNRALLAGALALAAPGAVPKPSRAAPLFDFAVAGGWYHGLKQAGDALALGERLALRAEPDNPHDADTVAVHRRDGLMLGYIPRSADEPLARLLRQARQIGAVVVGRLDCRRAADIADDLAFTGFTSGDPRIRLTLMAR